MMNRRTFFLSDVLRSTALCSMAALLLIADPVLAFNPQADSDPQPYSRIRSRIPSVAVASSTPEAAFPKITGASTERQIPTENPGALAQANAFAIPPATLPAASDSSAQAPVQEPVYAPAAPVANAVEAPMFPPVTPEVAARAQQEMQASMAPPPPQGFIAPAPLIPIQAADTAPIPSAPEPLATADALSQPVMQPALPALEPIEPAPAAALSNASKKIISRVPSKIDKTKPTKGGKMAVKRMSPELQSLVKSADVESYDAVGLSIKVQRPGLDTNFELNRAYGLMVAGETTQAIEIYKNIVGSEPNNQDALFGLASLYHRTGDLEKARPFYARLLKINPDHREGLNNFLALISDEAPQEALAELERLEQRNPDFSPIPAQQALLLKKLGYMDKAQERMLRAIELAPDNLSYKFNLAVILDTNGHYQDAGALYRLLIDAAMKGEKVPVSIEILQKRLNYIAAAPAFSGVVGG